MCAYSPIHILQELLLVPFIVLMLFRSSSIFEHYKAIIALLCTISEIACHPKKKMLLYHCYVLSNISWDLAIADLSRTWVIEDLDNNVAEYVSQWFEFPISATLSNLIISKSNYGLSLTLPCTKFLQCQTIILNALKSAANPDIKSFWQDSNTFTNIQHDQYRNAKQVLKSVQTHHQHCITIELTSKGLVIS